MLNYLKVNYERRLPLRGLLARVRVRFREMQLKIAELPEMQAVVEDRG